METSTDFLAPKLEGQRFEDHALPVNLLEDFSALEELILEVAKQIYLEENQQRKRVPKGFNDNVSLKLSNIEDGSVILKFVLATTLASSLLTGSIEEPVTYMEKARDRVIQVISNAKSGNIDPDLLSQKFLNFFNRIGKNLLEDESIDFLPNKSGQAVLNKNVRKKILLSRNEKIEYSDNISLNCSIPAINKKQGNFTLDIDGNSLVCNIEIAQDFQDAITQGFNEYENNVLVSLKGVGIYNQQDKLIRIEKIEAMDILDPFDVNVRLNQLSKIQDNWYEGYGNAPGPVFLKQFGEYFSSYFNKNLPLPSIFPTIEGNIQLEWTFPSGGAILEVNRKSLFSELMLSDADDNSEELNLNLESQGDWVILNEKINALI